MTMAKIFGVVPLFAAALVAAMLLGRRTPARTEARATSPSPTPASPSTSAGEVERESRDLRGAAEAGKETPSDPGDARTVFRTRFTELAKARQATGREGRHNDLNNQLYDLAKLGRSLGWEAVDDLARSLKEAKEADERCLAASLLWSIGDPAAVPALAQAIRDDGDETVRQVACFALAEIGARDALEPLRTTMYSNPDPWVRAIATYGLAAQHEEDGVIMLAQAYMSRDTPPERRLHIFWWMQRVADPSYAPAFREVLALELSQARTTSGDERFLRYAIGGVEKLGDVLALGDLQRVVDSDLSKTVRVAAEKAIKTIRE